eukprot:Plantae.Rhodophyta-Purpureofilum_apyrenoidigerum.ctg4653.p1 GENE.Plantae.Rhodophyta-Purpureofilum_apyrenoidigerum.ctg4653~~Plantae.Rhodophyta-Purpureofilum_apyrenoidigerum.ctg4653.p1  ORF type:complete len:746 (-),score=160.64 Plantae.Rhodophyta-Purpureofilum_apyrenoidigerum.ctg4653:61-2298(-)
MGDCFRVEALEQSQVNEKLTEKSVFGEAEEAKWAARALIRMNGDDSNLSIWKVFIEKARTRLKSVQEVGLDGCSGVLTSLVQIVSKCQPVWEKFGSEIADFCSRMLKGELALTIDKDVNFSTSSVCAIKILSHSVGTVVQHTGVLDTDRTDDVLSMLIRVTQKIGDIFQVCNENDEERYENQQCASVRLAAAVAVLRISRTLGTRAFPEIISPPVFMSTILTAQDANPDVRLNFATKIYKGILTKRLQFRWIVGLIFMAIDPDKQNLDAVRKYMTFLIKTWRMKIDEYKKSLETADVRSILPLLPESVLPSAVWMLAHHPDIKTDEEADFLDTGKYLEFFLSRLLLQSDFASFLVQILQTIALSEDATDPQSGSEGEIQDNADGTRLIRTVANIGLRILTDLQSGRKWDLTEYPGRFCLPEELYRTRQVSKSLRRAAQELDKAKTASSFQDSGAPLNDSSQVGDRGDRMTQLADNLVSQRKKTGRKKKRPAQVFMSDEFRGEDENGSASPLAKKSTVYGDEKSYRKVSFMETPPPPDSIAARAALRRRGAQIANVEPRSALEPTNMAQVKTAVETTSPEMNIVAQGDNEMPIDQPAENSGQEFAQTDGIEEGPTDEAGQNISDVLLSEKKPENNTTDQAGDENTKVETPVEDKLRKRRGRKKKSDSDGLTPVGKASSIAKADLTEERDNEGGDGEADAGESSHRTTPRRSRKRPRRYDTDEDVEASSARSSATTAVSKGTLTKAR